MRYLLLPRLSAALALLASLLTAGSVVAQTTPVWQSVNPVSTAPSGQSVVDAAGNTYSVGVVVGTNPVTVGGVTLTPQGSNDGYLAKFTPSGSLEWLFSINTAANEAFTDLALDAAGNVYVTGSFTGPLTLSSTITLTASSGSTQPKLFVARFSPQGIPQWAQQSSEMVGQFGYGNGIGLDAAGHVYVTGIYSRGITVGSSSVSVATNLGYAVFLARFGAATGALQNLTSAFAYQPTTGPGAYFQPRLAVGPAGETYVLNVFSQPVGFTSGTLTTAGLNDVLVAKYDAQGTFQWVGQAGGAAEDRMLNGQVDAAGNVYVAGYFTGTASFAPGTTLTGQGGTDGYLVKYSPQGTLQWVRTSSGPGSDVWNWVALDAAGNPYVTGYFGATAQFDTRTLASAGSTDVVVAAYSPQGTLRWLQQAGGPDADAGLSIGFDAGGGARVYGYCRATCAFGSTTLTTSSNPQYFLAQLGTGTLSTRPTAAQPLPLYPNPAHDQLHLPALPAGTAVQLVDALGRVVRQAPVTAGAVSVQGLSAGLYQLRATDAQGRRFAGRVLVQ